MREPGIHKKTAPAKSRDRLSCAKRLEQVANAKSKALPAEAGGREDVEERTPVKGKLQGEVEAVLQTNLCTNAKADVGRLAKTSPYLCGRTYIEVERSNGSDGEVIGQAKVKGAYAEIPTEVGFNEVGAEAMLIGKFCAVADTGTDCTRLCSCCNGEAENCSNDYKCFFHNTKKVLVSFILPCR